MVHPGILCRSVASAFMAMAAAAAHAQSQPPPSFTLDLAATAAQEVSLTVPAPTTIPFKIIHSGGAVGAGAAIDVGVFTNQQGVTVPVTVSLGSAPDTSAAHVD